MRLSELNPEPKSLACGLGSEAWGLGIVRVQGLGFRGLGGLGVRVPYKPDTFDTCP